jgi:hypothetical protein
MMMSKKYRKRWRWTMTTVNAVLRRAQSQLGIHEDPPGSNICVYTKWYGTTGPWCAMFLSWVFYYAGLPLPATTAKGFAYTPSGAAWFQRRGRWTRTPKAGHVVFFNWPGDGINRISHVGIVESVRADGAVITIEGNTGAAFGGSVMRRVRRSGIVGYGIPDYDRSTDDWFADATPVELEQAVRRVLNRGTAYGQRNWPGTNKATLAAIQHVVNLINLQVRPKLAAENPSVSTPQTVSPAAVEP